MRRDSERRPSWTTEAAVDHTGDAINPSLPPRLDAAPDSRVLAGYCRGLLVAVLALLLATVVALLVVIR